MATTWTVTGDVPDSYDIDGAGNPVLGHRVSFITGNGHRGSVFVAEDHYNPGAVRTLINGKARTVDEVASLNGEV